MTALPLPNSDKINNLEELYPHLPLSFDKIDTSFPIPNSETDGYSPIFRNSYLQNHDELVGYLHPKYKTFYHLFQENLKIHGDNNALGIRQKNSNGDLDNFFTFETYKELGIKRDYAGSAFLHLVEKYAPEADLNNFILTLFSSNKPEWIVSDLGSHAYSIPNTPLYDTLGSSAIKYILNLTESPIIVLSKNKVSKILEVNESKLLKILITIEDLSPDDQELISKAESQGYKIFDFQTILKIGQENLKPHRIPTPDTLYTISFTSGTTGIPKGVELKHSHVIASGSFLFIHVTFPRNPVSLVILPLAHVYERSKIIYELGKGAAIAFPSNPENPKTFLDDIKVLKPTHISAVPRLYNRIESGVKDKIQNTPGLKGWILRFAVNYKLNHQDDEFLVKLLNSLIINKIKQQIGFENLDFLISGGSPLSGESIFYLRKILNSGFYQGYGSSETLGGLAITTKFNKDTSRCGSIGVTSEFKLRDLPEMNYTFNENRSGELIVRGTQVFNTYFKNEEATKSSVDPDGWFSTGDIAQVDEFGSLAIIDRVKNFFKLSQGEYIASEKIENFYSGNNSFINQIFVYGDSYQNYLVGIIGIDENILLKILRSSSLKTKYGTLEQILTNLNDLELRKFILLELNKNIKHTGLYSFEQLKNIHLAIEPFTTEDDTITPTLKLKRPNCKKKFLNEINQLYNEGMI
ncbi:Long-chain-fatty-acid-CoA ligase [Wickerhamomyces ciferrii]|uniref:Long-chain-fatty-acid-CoA ligase n=1 Tax=Wickerhamomyces ciferrii (strain ATCC 14091 / BCRC 22168 / CBS 111 / JCM 3599 / NBRC 0793 / NRRL Y-1031 F-60-10) TaxID=1206466 RepID=K0KMA9_WICCF|nr:Long-chain-fatty-acid-CoA ligase [Wickerhamomyces ciferrii]CCH42248.1 Long-chain-fatty-acid-CoA ligase [Wickerhamomyces ciferrii]